MHKGRVLPVVPPLLLFIKIATLNAFYPTLGIISPKVVSLYFPLPSFQQTKALYKRTKKDTCLSSFRNAFIITYLKKIVNGLTKNP